MPWWSIILFTAISAIIAVCLGFSKSDLRPMSEMVLMSSIVSATTGFNIQIKYAIQVLAAFIHPGEPM